MKDCTENQLTKKEAIEFGESDIWKDWNDEQITRFQLFQEFIAIPFERYHKAIQNVLGRPVLAQEFGDDDLKKEYLGVKNAPSLKELVSVFSVENSIIIT